MIRSALATYGLTLSPWSTGKMVKLTIVLTVDSRSF
jgi:hypothetical protein